MSSGRGLGRAGAEMAVLYAVLVLAFTVIATVVAPAEALVGAARPASAIPEHLAELLGFGFILGGLCGVFYGRRGLPLVVLGPVLVATLDLDHMPAYLGLAQPIRPAHSLVFISVAVVFTAIVLRRLDLELLLVSSFAGHLGVDEGLFAPFSPFSFDYTQLDPYRIPLLACSVAAALLAGYLWRRRSGGRPQE